MRILITGAAGTGTSTLAKVLAEALGAVCLEADDFYWLPSSPPYVHKRDGPQRLALVESALQVAPRAVLAGSVMAWGASLEQRFSLIVFLYLDTDIRLRRLQARELERHGGVRPGFLEWAAAYDDGPASGRSLARHEAWLATRSCPVLRIEGDLTVEARLAIVLAQLATKEQCAGR